VSFDYTLLDSFDLDGRWGLPDWKNDQYVPGRLQFDPGNGTRLEVNGLLDELKRGPFELPPYKEVIHGVVSDGTKVTLLKCVSSGMSLTFSTDPRVRYHAAWMIVGEHLTSFQDASYTTVSVNFHNLEEFIGLQGFQHNSGTSGISIQYDFPQPLAMQLDDVAVKAEFSAHISGDAFHERQIVRRAWLTLTPEKETHFENLLTVPLVSLHQLMMSSARPSCALRQT
jgi:hypothetical protein